MTIPDELRRSTPRHVSLTLQGRAAVLSFALLMALFTSEIAWVSARGPGHGLPRVTGGFGIYLMAWIAVHLWMLPRQNRLLASGRAATARTTGEFRRVGFTGARRYRVKCEFTLLSGARSKATVECGALPAANSEILIVYDPDEPEQAMYYPSRMLRIDGI